MRRILLIALAALLALLAVNTVVSDRETKGAHADGGRIVDLPGGDLQVREDGSPARTARLLIAFDRGRPSR